MLSLMLLLKVTLSWAYLLEAPIVDSSDAEEPIEKVGEVQNVTWDDKVKKEIIVLGTGVKRPKRHALATISYKCYFFDHTPIEEVKEMVLELGDIKYPEGLWKGIEEMRKEETAKIKI